jgi:glucosamine--fructose-6-phosphate aminotransferase (isomerizing)
MCGIFGYIGTKNKDLSGFIVENLMKLEYRGYDSSGISVLNNGEFETIKAVGGISSLKNKIGKRKLAGSLGVGHTRWATHGKVTLANTHPHTDCEGKVVVVHNGIIENYQKLKDRLVAKGHKFTSETDTEVLTHLVEEKISDGQVFLDAVRASFNELEGLNAVVILSEYSELAGFKNGSPLVAGKANQSLLISSDTPALTTVTSNIAILNDGQGIYASSKGSFFVNAESGKKRNLKFERLNMSDVVEDKGKYKHYLLKEIMEQPQVVRIVAAGSRKDIDKAAKLIKNARGTYFTACGTASHAGMAATYMFSDIAKRHVNFAVGSEFPYFEDFLEKESLLIAASQSGETMDTLLSVKAAKRHSSKVLAMVNVPGSSLTRMADYTLYLKAGPERAVLSTKAYIAKLSVFLLLAYNMAGKYKQGLKILEDTSNKLSLLLSKEFLRKIKRVSEALVDKENIYILGRGVNYPTALEGALKIKEASYIHAEGIAAGELKHGVIALIEEGTPCIAIVANDDAGSSILSNAMEVKSRGAKVIGISFEDNDIFDTFIKVPDIPEASAIINVVPMQLLAYYLTLMKGYNPDKPRNLAKSVTVK